MSKKPDNNFRRCVLCGKFMSYADLSAGVCDFTPDTAFSSESVCYEHRACHERMNATISMTRGLDQAVPA